MHAFVDNLYPILHYVVCMSIKHKGVQLIGVAKKHSFATLVDLTKKFEV